MVGKALCFLGYLMFRVFLETDNPYQEKIESAKSPKHNTNPNCGIPEMFCLRRLSRPVRIQSSDFRKTTRLPALIPSLLWWQPCRLQEKSTRHACHHRNEPRPTTAATTPE